MEMKLNLNDAKKAGAAGSDGLSRLRPLRMLHERGVRSDHAYLIGLAALGTAVASRLIAGKSHEHGTGFSHFMAKSVPVFLLVGLALKHEE